MWQPVRARCSDTQRLEPVCIHRPGCVRRARRDTVTSHGWLD